MGPPSPSAAPAGPQPEPEALNAKQQDEDEQEEEELMFAFEAEEPARPLPSPPAFFRSISDFHPLARPSNPLAAVLQGEAGHEDEDAAPRVRTDGGPRPQSAFGPSTFDFNGRRKRRADEGPVDITVTPVSRPIPKRARLDRSATAPPSFMRAPSPAGRPRSRSSSNEPSRESADEPSGDAESSASRPLSASIAIPASAFRPIRPAGSSLADSTHSSASSSKSWTGSFCRRSLDVSSPVRSRLGDLVISSSTARTASFDGS